MKGLWGVSALSLFFLVGAILAGVAAVSLAFPGSMLEPMWRLNPRGNRGLAGLHGWGVLLLAVASSGCAVAGVGLWRRRSWGHTVAVVVLLVQLAGDILNVASGAEPRAAIGVPIVAGLLIYLMRPSIRGVFHDRGRS